MLDQPSPPRTGINVPAVGSFVCIALQALWVAACYLFASRAGSDATTAEDVVKGWLAVLAAMFGAFVGVCLLSAIGVAFGVAGRRSGWGLLALALNTVACLCTAVAMLLLYLTPQTQ